MNVPLLERYCDRIAGILTCYDRVVITGTLPGACYAAGIERQGLGGIGRGEHSVHRQGACAQGSGGRRGDQGAG